MKMLEPRVYFEQFCHLTRAVQSIDASEKQNPTSMFLARQKWKGSNIVENETKPLGPDFLAFRLNSHCLESEHEQVTAQNKACSYPV